MVSNNTNEEILGQLDLSTEEALSRVKLKNFVCQTQSVISKQKYNAYVKVSLLLYGVFLGIFPGVPLFFTEFFMNNFFELLPYVVISVPLNLGVASIVGICVNNLIIKKKIPFLWEHRDIIARTEQKAEVNKQYPDLKYSSPKEIKKVYLERFAYAKRQKVKQAGKGRVSCSVVPKVSKVLKGLNLLIQKFYMNAEINAEPSFRGRYPGYEGLKQRRLILSRKK